MAALLSRIIAVPGSDGVNQMADVHNTSVDIMRRAFNWLCPLPKMLDQNVLFLRGFGKQPLNSWVKAVLAPIALDGGLGGVHYPA